MIVPLAAAPWIVAQRASDFLRIVCAEYARLVARDYAEMAPYLPERAGTILDVGCGVGGIDVLLKRRYPDAALLLLDGDGPAEMVPGFHEAYRPYNSRAVTDELLAANGVDGATWLDVGTTEVLKADLVVSLLSWGFHYPISTYRIAGPATIVCDVRRAHRSDAEAAFGVPHAVLRSEPKYLRCAWRVR